MSFLKKNFSKRPSLLKPISILVAVLLVIGSAYVVLGNKKSAENSEENSEEKVVGSGLDASKKIENVGDVEEVIAKIYKEK